MKKKFVIFLIGKLQISFSLLFTFKLSSFARSELNNNNLGFQNYLV